MLGGIGWLTAQIQGYGYKDYRNQQRLEKIMTRFSVADVSAGFPSVFPTKHELKAFYSLMNQQQTTHGQLLACFRSNLALEQGKTYFILQDTTSLNFSTQAQKQGMGYLTELTQRGLFLHNSLLLSEQGMPLGLVDQQLIIRSDEEYGKKHERAKREFSQKESYKWAEGLMAAGQLSREHQCSFIHIMDREGDVLEVIQLARQEKQHIAIRARHDRKLIGEDEQVLRLTQHLEQAEPVELELKLPAGHDKLEKHTCELRWKKVMLKGEPLWVVQLKSLTHPEIEWIVLTSLEVENQEQALKIVGYYKLRWLVEELHKGLKTGCKVERRQFTSLQATTNSIALLSLVAVWLLRIKLQAKQEPDEDLGATVTADEQQVLELLAEQYLRPLQKKKLVPFSAKWLAVLLGNMGGFVGNQDRHMPGWQTLWLGYTRYKAFLNAFLQGKIASKPVG